MAPLHTCVAFQYLDAFYLDTLHVLSFFSYPIPYIELVYEQKIGASPSTSPRNTSSPCQSDGSLYTSWPRRVQ